jgi:hypothetical protein
MDKRIYMDHAATTPVSAAALEAMLPYFTRAFGNPSATYSYGQEAKKALEESRRTVARVLGAKYNEIFLPPAGPRPTTGPSAAPVSSTKKKAGISFPPKLSIARYSVPWNCSKDRAGSLPF